MSNSNSEVVDEKKLERSLVKQFYTRNGFKSSLAILWDWFIIISFITLSIQFNNIFFYFITIWIIAGRMMALGEVLGHEAVHYSLYVKKEMNRWLDFLFFLPVFNTFESYQQEHAIHHHDCLTDIDPTIIEYKRWGLYDKNVNIFYVWWVRPFLFFDTFYFIKTIFSELVDNSLFRKKILIFWSIVGSLFWYFNSLDILFFYWIVPFFWAKPALEFWSEVTDHFRVLNSDTRSCGGLFHTIFLNGHNDGYHEVHHRWAAIPWYNLPAAHKALIKDKTSQKLYGFVETYQQIRDYKATT